MFEISVLIPTYNRANTLDRALDSLNAQTYKKKFICIISDNNSSDETEEIVNKWKNTNTSFEIEYYKQEKPYYQLITGNFLLVNRKLYILKSYLMMTG